MQHHAGAILHHDRRKHHELCAGYGFPARSDWTNFRRRGQGGSEANFPCESQAKGKFIARQSHAISARQSGCAAFDPFHLSRFAKGANVSRSLLADSGVAGVSSGRLAVVISTPTIEAKAATVSFPKIDLENGVFQRSGSFLLMVTVVLLIRWSGYGRALSRRCFTATASKRQPSTAGCRARPH